MNTTKQNVTADKNLAQRCVQSCKKWIREIESVKNKIQQEFRATKLAQASLFQQAVNEAEALARQTDYPHLLFPSLALEKVQAVAAWQTRQRFVQRREFIFAEAV